METKYITLEKEFDRLTACGWNFDRSKLEKFVEDYAKTVLLWRNASQKWVTLTLELAMHDKLKEMVDSAQSNGENSRGDIKTLSIPDYTLIELFRVVQLKYPQDCYNLGAPSP